MLATDYDRSKLEHLPTIIIKTIPHDQQRYESVGDWRYMDDGGLLITVSETNAKYEFLVAVHELIEAMLCNFKGIKEEDVTDFDLNFESMREDYPVIVGDKEPGDEDAAPYTHEHKMASQVENWLARSFGVDWAEYEKTLNGLEKF